MNNRIRKSLIASLSKELIGNEEFEAMNNALRLLAKWKSVFLQESLIKDGGTVVRSGPFQGMDFLPNSSEGCHIAKLIGCFEQPLQPFIEEAISSSYTNILNIGCAEGYYAVGMARRMTNTQILAFDLNLKAQEVCSDLAKKNGVTERVTIGNLFKPEDFERYQGTRALVLCDIEGAEKELLNPEIAPALKAMDLIVESHECLVPGITQNLIDRFKESHQITIVQDDGQRQLQKMPNWFNNIPNLDQLLAVWEWRSGPTPWLVMKCKGTKR
jgi:predicted O-methyltransferase YrrM